METEKRTARDKLLENGIDEDVMLFEEDVFIDSLIGTVMMPDVRAVYDYDKMVEEWVTYYGMAYDEAADYISYNFCRYIGYLHNPGAPIIIDSFVI